MKPHKRKEQFETLARELNEIDQQYPEMLALNKRLVQSWWFAAVVNAAALMWHTYAIVIFTSEYHWIFLLGVLINGGMLVYLFDKRRFTPTILHTNKAYIWRKMEE